MKRLLCLLAAALLLLPCAVRAQELDEETLAALETDPRAPGQIEEAPELVYAETDVDETLVETLIDAGEQPEYVRQLLDVAREELGYTEGPNNLTKYGEWSGDKNAAWCAEFVCWCVDQVDQRCGTGLLNAVYPNYSGQNTGRDWFIARGRFVYRKGICPNWGSQWLREDHHDLKKNEYIPRPGDLVFFSYNEAGDTEHVALVEYAAYDAEGVTIHVIEGNNPSAVQRNRYRLNNSQVLGFGLCEDLVDTTIRYGNRGDKVRALQEALVLLGYLEERNVTGVCGSHTKRAVLDFQTARLPDHTANGIADRETQQAIAYEVDRLLYHTPETWLVQ